jgi:serine/threonine-protein kinase
MPARQPDPQDPQESQDPLLHQTIEGYRLVRVLGAGGTSIVYLGERIGDAVEEGRGGTKGTGAADAGAGARELPAAVAIKVLADLDGAAPVDRAAFRARFLREARATSQLSHPHIVPLLSYGALDDRVYLLFPLMPGGSLADHLADHLAEWPGGRPPLDRIAEWLTQVADALDYAHHRGVVHRDLKPGNLLLDAADQLHLADFGLARLVGGEALTRERSGPLTRTGQVLGTPYYMAPEQIKGELIGPATDIYALGVVLYQLVTGAVPFAGETPLVVAMQHLNEPPSLPSRWRREVTPQLDAVLLRPLAKGPADRDPTAGALATAFTAALPASAAPLPSLGPRTPPASQPAASQANAGMTQPVAAAASASVASRKTPEQVTPTVDTQPDAASRLDTPSHLAQIANTPMPSSAPAASPAEPTPANQHTAPDVTEETPPHPHDAMSNGELAGTELATVATPPAMEHPGDMPRKGAQAAAAAPSAPSLTAGVPASAPRSRSRETPPLRVVLTLVAAVLLLAVGVTVALQRGAEAQRQMQRATQATQTANQFTDNHSASQTANPYTENHPATQITLATQPYRAQAPGWSCDGGGARWFPPVNLSVACQGTTSRMTRGIALYPGMVPFLWLDGLTFPVNQQVSVQISDMTAGACGGVVLRKTDVAGGYGYFVCQNGRWYVNRYDTSSFNAIRLAEGTITSQNAYTITAIASGARLSLSINGKRVRELSDDTYQTANYLDVAVDGEGEDNTATFSNFVFTPM